MTDLDRSSLDRLLPSMPGPADWGDVLSRSDAQQRRSRLVVVLAALAVAAAATASAFGMRALFLDKGFIGLPPDGATPSTPETGELEIFFRVGHPKLGRSRAWVYADGRLVWLRERADIPQAANPLSTGFLEQRLTPEGVERLRSEIASAGDFGSPNELAPPPGKPPCPSGVSPIEGNCQLPTPEPAPDAPITVPFHTPIEVAGLGTLVHVDHARDLTRLQTRLSDPGLWLPASAWADRDIRAYVASKYAVCYSGWPPDRPVEPSPLLPSAVRDLLGDASLRQGPLFGEPGNFRPSYEYCADKTTDEARAIAVALDDAGFQRQGAYRLKYRLEAPGSNPSEAEVWFEPYLPHGEITCSVCG